MVANGLLKQAVHHNQVTSRRGVLERMFTLWFRGFVYNQIWEDPQVDAEALDLGPDSRVLTISSGGCNVLNYLINRPARIVAVDLNAAHLALLRLKLAALRSLPDYEAFYRFFGLGNQKDNVHNYHRYVRGALDESTRGFWESSRWPLMRIGPKRIGYFGKGIYDQSKSGLLLRFAHRLAKIARKDPARLLEARTLEDQEAFFAQVVEPFFNNRFIRLLASRPSMVFSLGIPPSQHRIMVDESQGRLIDLYLERIRRLACGFPIEENYFAWQAFGRRYDHEHRRALPDYLREEHYATMRAGVDRVETHLQSLSGYLAAQPDDSLDRFVLLDSQDWMPPDVINDLWRQIARVGRPGSRIIFRTAGVESPVERSLSPVLRERFIFEEERSRTYHARDRAAIYGMFHLYTLKG